MKKPLKIPTRGRGRGSSSNPSGMEIQFKRDGESHSGTFHGRGMDIFCQNHAHNEILNFSKKEKKKKNENRKKNIIIILMF